MASRIKGITIEINGDTTKLSQALRETDTQLTTVQKNLRDVERLLKLDPTNTADSGGAVRARGGSAGGDGG